MRQQSNIWVFFRRNDKGTNPQDKLRFYYAQDTQIRADTVFVLKGTTYFVISQDGIERNVYCTSRAVKCDTSFIWTNAENRFSVHVEKCGIWNICEV